MRSPAAALFAIIACALAILAPPAAAEEDDSPVVLIGTGGVMWEYISEDDTPNLHRFSQTADIGSISVRAIHPATCPTEGWLTLGAGERAGDSVTDGGACRVAEEPVPSPTGGWTIPHWEQYETFAENSAYSARLGQLGDLTVDMETLAVGPGAAIALAESGGRVEDYASLDDLAGRTAGKDLILIDLGAITQKDQKVFDEVEPRPTGDPFSASFIPQEWDEDQIREGVKELDDRLGTVLADLDAAVPDARVMIVSLSDYSATASTLQAIMIGSDGTGVLTSSTTRRDGLVTSTDLLPSLIEGAEGPGMTIVSIDAGTAAENRAAAAELESLTRAIKPSTGPVYAMWGGLWLLVFFSTLIFRRRRVLHGAVLAAASLPAASVAMNFVPWHRASSPTAALLAGTLVITVIIGGAALYVRRYGREFPAGLVASVTLAAFLLPLLVGSPLALNSPFGALPQVGRFYGMTNMMFAIVGAAGLVLAGTLASRIADRKRAAIAVLAVGAVVIIVDGSPWHGTDFGGPPVLTVAFLMLAILVSGRRITVLNGAVVVTIAAVITALFAVVDYLRPIEDRTHLGDFVESVINGTAMAVIVRKAGQVLALWPLILILALALAVIFFALRSRNVTVRNPLDSDGNVWVWVSAAQFIVLVGGMLLNDSGPIIVVAGGMVAIPLIASAVYCHESQADMAGSVLSR